jgi:hypothetical protein
MGRWDRVTQMGRYRVTQMGRYRVTQMGRYRVTQMGRCILLLFFGVIFALLGPSGDPKTPY